MAKVVLLGSYAPSLINFRGDFIKQMVSSGNAVIACAPDASLELIKKLHEMGAHYQNVPLSRTGLNPVNDVSTFLFLFKLFRKHRPDYVFSYTIKPVIYGSLAAKLARVPNIYAMITGLGSVFSSAGTKAGIIRWWVSILYRVSLAVNNRIFFQNSDDVSEFLKRKILKSADKAVLINGSGVNVHFFEPCQYPTTITFLLIARFLKDKGLIEYVEAASIIKEKYPFVQFDLVGWRDENPACISESQLDVLIAKGNVRCLGKLDDVRPAIANASVYVLPSYREGRPRTVLEAMAMGRPIISTDAPGCRETVVENDNGFLVPIKNVSKLAAAMEKFIQQPELIPVMGARSRALAVEKYDVQKINAIILETMELL